MGPGNRSTAHRESDAGMGTLAPEAFEPALLELVADWLDPERSTEIVACGMVGARQGWVEARYGTVPCPPLGDVPTRVTPKDPRISVMIVAGLSQNEPADVMRGEETQIAGYLLAHPHFSGTVCLPGTHTKWVAVEDGTVVRFATFMTGELFALLSGRSVLRHGMAGQAWDAEAFDGGVDVSVTDPAASWANLFGLRASGLLHGLEPSAARARLSGLLIGAEVAAARDYIELGQVVLIGAPKLVDLYSSAIGRVGGKSDIADGDEMTLAGLVSAYRKYGTH